MEAEGSGDFARVGQLFAEACRLHGKELEDFLARIEDPAIHDELVELLAADENPLAGLAGDPAETILVADEQMPNEVGPYRILGELGEGGMGTVYLAEQRQPVRRRVALKVVKLGMDTKAVLRRFEAERQALAMMEHGNIARVLDAGATDQGRPYFAMEYVKGVPISTYCDDHKLGLDERLGLFRQVCSGVQHAHNKGVIHRDLKPSNILVTLQDGQPRVKIIDFGLARATNHHLVEATLFTEQGQIIGTPEYMSPEQAGLGGLDIDTRTDVYSLGVILYELLSGSLPFDTKELREAGLHEIQRRIREDDPPRPSTKLTTMDARSSATAAARRRTSLPALKRVLRGDLDWVVMKALEKDRSRRYETAAQLEEDVRRHQDLEPVHASPPSVVYRMRKFVRRYRGQVAAAAALLVVLMGGIAGTSVGLVHANQSARIAKANEARADAEAREADRQRRIAVEANRDFNRLKVAVLIERARTRAAGLFPAWPENAAALRAWLADEWTPISRARVELEATLVRLRQSALPETEAQAAAAAEARREELGPFERRVASCQRALEVQRGGADVPEVTLPADLAARSADEMLDFVWQRVHWEDRRRSHGGEAVALACARAIRAQAPPDDKPVATLALLQALYVNGLHDEALATARDALKAAAPERREMYASMLAQTERSVSDARAAPGARVAAARAELARRERLLDYRRPLSLPNEAAQFLHDAVGAILVDIDALEHEQVRNVEDGLAWAERVERLSIADHRQRWRLAREAISKADGSAASELYARQPLELAPQIGLVPIGMNPKTRLWEFYHLRSGREGQPIPEPSDYDGDGGLAGSDDAGIVFVLIPGGTFTMGAQPDDPAGPNHDPRATRFEHPLADVTLAPYFLAKHELTQGQWQRLSDGEIPSRYLVGRSFKGIPVVVGYAHPVESVRWTACDALLSRHGLALPTEAQWEYACRAGTRSPWSSGNEPGSLAGHANVLDRHTLTLYSNWNGGTGEDFDDGFTGPAPVGRYRPNPWGLHDVHGNVWEYCRDFFAPYRLSRPEGPQGLRIPPVLERHHHAIRGGGFYGAAGAARASARDGKSASTRDGGLGVRPARAVR